MDKEFVKKAKLFFVVKTTAPIGQLPKHAGIDVVMAVTKPKNYVSVSKYGLQEEFRFYPSVSKAVEYCYTHKLKWEYMFRPDIVRIYN